VFATVGELKAQTLADTNQFPASFAMADEAIAAYRRLVILANNSPGKLRSLAVALTTRGGSFTTGADMQACGAWREPLGVFIGLDRRDGDRAVSEARHISSPTYSAGKVRFGGLQGWEAKRLRSPRAATGRLMTARQGVGIRQAATTVC
jgi:hypothetical protein